MVAVEVLKFYFRWLCYQFQDLTYMWMELLLYSNSSLRISSICKKWYCSYIANSITFALGIGNWPSGSSCLAFVIQVNHCIVSYAQMPNVQLTMTNLFMYFKSCISIVKYKSTLKKKWKNKQTYLLWELYGSLLIDITLKDRNRQRFSVA